MHFKTIKTYIFQYYFRLFITFSTSAVINFIILAFVLFCMLKAMNKLMDLGKHEEEKPAEPEAPKAPTQEELLTEILAVLKEQQAANGK